jgi:hypothetical protein
MMCPGEFEIPLPPIVGNGMAVTFDDSLFQEGCKPDTCQPRVKRSGALGYNQTL